MDRRLNHWTGMAQVKSGQLENTQNNSRQAICPPNLWPVIKCMDRDL